MLLAHKPWKNKALLAEFVSADYDEARILATHMAQSSSASLDSLSALLAEISAEIHSVILSHHSSLLQLNSHILLISTEVATVVRRVAALRTALARIQSSLLTPFSTLQTQLDQMHRMQDTAEHIRQAIRVMHFCEKLKLIMNPAATATAAANGGTAVTPRGGVGADTPSSAATAPSSSSSGPALRDLVKASTLLYEIGCVFSVVNLNGLRCIDDHLPFLNHTSETIHNTARKKIYEAMRGGASSAASAASAAAPVLTPQIQQLDLNYIVQLFYNLAPNPHAQSTLDTLERRAEEERAQRRRRRRGGRGDDDDDRAASLLPDFSASADADGDDPASPANAGGVELILVLDELVCSYLEQVRAALRKILDIAASSAHALNLQGAAKRAAAAGKKGTTAAAAAAAAAASSAPTPSSLRSTLWDRLDSFIELLFNLSVQIWTLGRLLHEKVEVLHNAAPGVSFGVIYRTQRAILRDRQNKERREAEKSAVSNAGGNRHALAAAALAAAQAQEKEDADAAAESESGEVSLMHTFWRALCELLRAEFDPIASSTSSASAAVPGSLSSTVASSHSSSNFLRTIFVNEYPRLHQLFDRSLIERFGKYVAGHAASAASTASSIIAQASASGVASSTGASAATAAASAAALASFASNSSADSTPPPTLDSRSRQQLLSSFLPFLQLYLSRSLTALTDPIHLMFTAHEHSGSAASVPSRSDVSAYLSVLSSSLDSVCDVRDPEVQRLQVRAVHKSVQLFVQHAERMLVSDETDADIFSSAHMPTGLQADGLMTTAGGGKSGAAVISASAAAGMVSQTQRQNLDVFAILLQLERELTETELARKWPQLFANVRATNAAAATTGAAAPASSTNSWSVATAAQSPALAALRECWLAVRTLQTEALTILLAHTSHALCGALTPLVLELDAEPGASPAALMAAQNFAAAPPPPEGSPAFLSFRRKLLYCLHVLFPLYTNMLSGASSNASSAAAAAAAAAGAGAAPSADVHARLSLFQSTLLVPLHSNLCSAFLRSMSLVPLTAASAPTSVSESLRAHHAQVTTLFEALAQQMLRQQKRSLRIQSIASASSSASILSGSADDPAAPLAIDGLHAWKELLHARAASDFAHVHASKSVDVVTLLQFLLTNASMRLPSVPASSAGVKGVAHSSPHRLLQMRVDDYAKFVATHNQIEIFELMHKVYTLLESAVPSIPKGPAGRSYLAEHYPNLSLALKILTKHG